MVNYLNSYEILPQLISMSLIGFLRYNMNNVFHSKLLKWRFVLLSLIQNKAIIGSGRICENRHIRNSYR